MIFGTRRVKGEQRPEPKGRTHWTAVNAKRQESSTTHRKTFTVIALLIVFLHRENIRRLLAGTEPRVGRKG